MKYVDNNYRYEDLSFNGLNLMCHGMETGLKLEIDENFRHMYWIIRDPDFRSDKAYNLTNAKEGAKNFFLAHMNSDEPDINKIRYPVSQLEARTEVL